MIKNGNTPAMPVIEETKAEQYNGGTYTTATAMSLGLTKREMLAMSAMQGLFASGYAATITEIASDAVVAADALLAELERTNGL
jgi:hypothetical protein